MSKEEYETSADFTHDMEEALALLQKVNDIITTPKWFNHLRDAQDDHPVDVVMPMYHVIVALSETRTYLGTVATRLEDAA